MATLPATAAQMNYLHALIARHEVPEELVESARSVDRAQASRLIDQIKNLPRKGGSVRFETAPTDEFAVYLNALAAVAHNSKYALPTQLVEDAAPGYSGPLGLLFVEVRQYEGRRYLNQLHGAPGDFTRSRFNLPIGTAILRLIAGHEVEYARLFGEHYSVCGRCAAPLTDEDSRALGFGPECRKLMGV